MTQDKPVNTGLDQGQSSESGAGPLLTAADFMREIRGLFDKHGRTRGPVRLSPACTEWLHSAPAAASDGVRGSEGDVPANCICDQVGTEACLAHFAKLNQDAGKVAPQQPSVPSEPAGALRDALRWFWNYDEGANERFERIADWFRSETGMLRPGKDVPGAMNNPHTEEECAAAFESWCEKRGRAARQIIVDALEASSAPAVVSDNVQKMEGDSASSSSRGGTSPEVEELERRLAAFKPLNTRDVAWWYGQLNGAKAVAEDAISRLRASTTTAEARHPDDSWSMDYGGGPAPHVARTEKAKFCHHGDGCSESWHVGGNYGSPVCKNPAHHVAPPEETTK